MPEPDSSFETPNSTEFTGTTDGWEAGEAATGKSEHGIIAYVSLTSTVPPIYQNISTNPLPTCLRSHHESCILAVESVTS